MSKREPQRTCVGCREATDAGDLVRVVASPEGELVVDLRGRLPGRGAWVHAAPSCLEAAIRTVPKALAGRARPLAIDATVLPERVRSSLVHATAEAMSIAAAGGGLARGRSAVEQGVRDGRVVVLLITSDAAERTVRQVQSWEAQWADDEDESPLMSQRLPFTSDEVGQQVGRGALAVLGVLDAPASQHLLRQLRRLRSLG